jgi:hypothetical protein
MTPGASVADPALGPQPTTRPASPTEALFEKCSPAVVQIVVYDRTGGQTALGSGFILEKDGRVVTNQHVIDKAASANILMSNKKVLPVTSVIAADENQDIALLRVGGKELPTLALETQIPKIGAKAFAIGSPKGFINTLSDGLISGLREEPDAKWIQTSCPVSQGSSGGPLLNESGAVVGITTWGIKGGQSLNFAAPASAIEATVKAGKGAATLGKPPTVTAKDIEAGLGGAVEIVVKKKVVGTAVIPAFMQTMASVLTSKNETEVQKKARLEKSLENIDHVEMILVLSVVDVTVDSKTGEVLITAGPVDTKGMNKLDLQVRSLFPAVQMFFDGRPSSAFVGCSSPCSWTKGIRIIASVDKAALAAKLSKGARIEIRGAVQALLGEVDRDRLTGVSVAIVKMETVTQNIRTLCVINMPRFTLKFRDGDKFVEVEHAK